MTQRLYTHFKKRLPILFFYPMDSELRIINAKVRDLNRFLFYVNWELILLLLTYFSKKTNIHGLVIAELLSLINNLLIRFNRYVETYYR